MKLTQNSQYALIAAAAAVGLYLVYNDGTALAVTGILVAGGLTAAFIYL